MFYPVQVVVELADGDHVNYVLKANRDPQKIKFEINILKALHELGLHVPEIKSEVFQFNHDREELTGVLLTEVNGKSLPWLGLNDLKVADSTGRLTISAIKKLHSLTPYIAAHKIALDLPKKTLQNELDLINKNAGKWKDYLIFNESLELMNRLVPQIHASLVFSNGDYNPLNFLVCNNNLVGWIDFEHACFEDPHIGFAKMFLWANDEYGWGVGSKSGLVEKYLFENMISPKDFYIRIILRGLFYIHLMKIEDYPEYMLRVVEKYTGKVKFSTLY